MTERGSASDMSEPEPSAAPAPVATSLPGDIAMAEVEPTGSEPREEPTVNEETGDQLSGNQPSSDQATNNNEQSMEDLPTCGQPKDSKVEQTICDQATNNNEQSMGDLPTCGQPKDSEVEQTICDQANNAQSMGEEPTCTSTDDQPMPETPTAEQPLCDQITEGPMDDQGMSDQPTDVKLNDDHTSDDLPADNDHPMVDESINDEPIDYTSTCPENFMYTENLMISEIEKNEVIFGRDFKEYFEMQARREAWQKVCEGLFPRWSLFTPIQKKKLSKSVQNKWSKVRKRFFKSLGRIRKNLIYRRNAQHAFMSTLETSAAQAVNTGLDEVLAETIKEEEQNGEQNANNMNERSFRKEQNANGEEHVHSVPIPENVPREKDPDIFVKVAVPSSTGQIKRIGLGGHMPKTPPVMAPQTTHGAQYEKKRYMPQTPAAAVPTTSAQYVNQGHISKTPTAAVPSTSGKLYYNKGHMPQTPAEAVPSTSAHAAQGPLPPINEENRANMNNIPLLNPFEYNQSIDPNIYQPIHYLTSPMPAVMPFLGVNESGEWIPNDIVPLNTVERSIDCAAHLCAMMETLDDDQQCAVWPKLVALIVKASKLKRKKIKILQGELLTDNKTPAGYRMPATGPEIILEDTFPELELQDQEPFPDLELQVQEPLADSQLVVQEPLTAPEIAQESLADPKVGIQQTLAGSLEDKETLMEQALEETEEEPVYSSSHGRPTNAQGEIMYPETDQEDLDED